MINPGFLAGVLTHDLVFFLHFSAKRRMLDHHYQSFLKGVYSGFYWRGLHKREKIGYINCEIRIDLVWFF